MCGLFGFSNYGNEKIKDLKILTASLAEQSAARGTDATGFAICSLGRIAIQKEAKSAYKLNIKHNDDVKALIGHTRHSTQGSEKKNYNNHPFFGKIKGARFALAHNGVLSNDTELRKKLKLPHTKIETDSYIAVQLLESKNKLNLDNVKYMAEQVEGSFSFSILDDKNNIYLVKGDSPLSILHFPKQKLYVYASTDKILYKALVDSPLFNLIKSGAYEEVKVSDGEILEIQHNGKLKRKSFKYSGYLGKGWWDYGYLDSQLYASSYIDDLKSVASFNGYSPDEIDALICDGFTPEEIEEYLYCGMGCEI